jgi:hypothetical protein
MYIYIYYTHTHTHTHPPAAGNEHGLKRLHQPRQRALQRLHARRRRLDGYIRNGQRALGALEASAGGLVLRCRVAQPVGQVGERVLLGTVLLLQRSVPVAEGRRVHVPGSQAR